MDRVQCLSLLLAMLNLPFRNQLTLRYHIYEVNQNSWNMNISEVYRHSHKQYNGRDISVVVLVRPKIILRTTMECHDKQVVFYFLFNNSKETYSFNLMPRQPHLFSDCSGHSGMVKY